MHGEGRRGKRTAEFSVWLGVVRRCTDVKNPLYIYYGSRGIKVCDRWRDSYENFLADMGRKPTTGHTIERKDNDGDYTPDNCVWATKKEQMRNTRRAIRITLDGVTKVLKEWAEISGVSYKVAHYRLKVGWDPRAAIFTPARGKSHVSC